MGFQEGRSVVEARLEDALRVNLVVVSRHGNRDKACRIHAVSVTEIEKLPPRRSIHVRVFQPCPIGIKLDVKHISTIGNAD